MVLQKFLYQVKKFILFVVIIHTHQSPLFISEPQLGQKFVRQLTPYPHSEHLSHIKDDVPFISIHSPFFRSGSASGAFRKSAMQLSISSALALSTFDRAIYSSWFVLNKLLRLIILSSIILRLIKSLIVISHICTAVWAIVRLGISCVTSTLRAFPSLIIIISIYPIPLLPLWLCRGQSVNQH